MKIAGKPLRIAVALLACLALAGLSALALSAQEGSRPLNPSFVDKADSPSGLKWIAGNRGSPYMHPGMSCITCHNASGGEAPSYLSAGTVYTKLNEADNILGVEGAVVQITDAKGQIFKMTTNKAGNFFLRAGGASLALPINALVSFKGAERKMLGAKQSGNCMLCHTASGVGGAPGRIIVP